MNRKIIFAIIIVSLVWISAFDAFSIGKFFRIRGFFVPETTWTGGHPGKVLFDIGASNSALSAGIDVDGYLSGAFWLGNVGWGVFNHGDASVARAKVLCDNSVFYNENILCPLDWFAWSQNAGWIALSGSFINGGSGVYYNPASGRIEGFAHSRALGWVPMYADAATPVSIASQTGVLFDGIGLNFIGRIAIIGNIAGTRIYNVTNQQLGYVFSSINHSEMLNTIRKNIAILSRNAVPSELADTFSSKFNFMIQRGSDYDTSGWWWTWPSAKNSIIIIWGDIILDESQIGLDTAANRAMIAIKDENGNGGNIIITENVGRIYGFLYAEWSIYSGIKTLTGLIVPYVAAWVWNIPANQLYIKWAVVSKNTVWWSLQSPPTCPVIIQNCTSSESQIYDFNYFRTYDPSDASQKHVPYDDPRFWVASTIIEYNQTLAHDPPPAVVSVFQ